MAGGPPVIEMPDVGLGTWNLRGQEAVRAVARALDLGYRHLDTAQMYRNETEVGRGLRESGVPREQAFLTTKVLMGNYPRARFLPSVERSMRDLGVEAVDLLLLHWPDPSTPLEEQLEGLAAALERGYARRVGVSNFGADLVRRARAAVPVYTNQVEYSPYRQWRDLLEDARTSGYFLTAYTPLAKGRVARDPVLLEIAKVHGRTAAQVALRWLTQSGLRVIPKAAGEARQRENLDLDFELSDDEMRRVEALGTPGR
jgi:diketogulonate reductase-like aldo/keto reductase